MSLNLLLDNADPSEWGKWLKSGIFNGVTTNPTLLKKAGQKCSLTNLKGLCKKAQDLGCKEIHIQAWGQNSDELANCGLSLAELSNKEIDVYVKIPITIEGIKAARRLLEHEVNITFTACYEAKQVLIATAIGAKYIAPYMGRINDLGKDGRQEITSMQRILEGLESHCKILVASIRSCEDINHLAANGVCTFTLSTDIAYKLLHSKETAKAAKIFEKDSISNCN